MDRRSRGKRKSANCIQRCLRFSFLRFMADPEKKVDSRKLKVKGKTKPKKRKDLTQRTQRTGTQRARSTEVDGRKLKVEGKTKPEEAIGAQKQKRPYSGRGAVLNGSILLEP